MCKCRLLILLIFFLATPSGLLGQAADSSFVLFPSQKIFPILTADALTPRFALSRVTDNREWIGTIGANVPLVQAGISGATIQISAGAAVYNTLIKTPGHITVLTVDYKVDFPVDLRWDENVLRIFFGHISAHYADDGIEQLNRSSISYVKDYVAAAYVRHIASVDGYAYSGITYNYHNEPVLDKKILLQFGGEVGIFPLTSYLQTYAAVDVKLRQEVNWGTTQSYQAGLKLSGGGSSELRFCYTLRTGYEERGQMFESTVTQNMFSLFLDF